MIDFPANPTLGQQFTSAGTTWEWDGKKWVGVGGGPFLPIAGGSMGGVLLLAEDPVQATEAATKEYVDARGAVEGIPIGGILIWPGDGSWSANSGPPPNYVLCNGAYYNPADLPLLFNVLQGAYGWDGANFAVPNMLDRTVVGAGYSYGITAMAGESSHVLDGNELTNHAHSVYDPTHAHSLSDPTHGHGIGDPGHGHGFPDPGHAHGGTMRQTTGFFALAAQNPQITASSTDGAGTGRTIQAAGTGIWTGGAYTGQGVYGAGTGIGIYAAGASWGHNNMQPYIALYYYIRYR